MIIIIHSDSTEGTIKANFGGAEYSYFFVLKEFLPILRRLGRVVIVEDPETEVDPIYQQARHNNSFCVFLSFAPPHKTYIGNKCPTIPVLAWEFNDIPTQCWDDEPRNDWRLVLGIFGQAITHSNDAKIAIRKAMRPDYPVISVPSPVWDRYHAIGSKHQKQGYSGGFTLGVDGIVIDTQGEIHAGSMAGNIDKYRVKSKQLHLSGVVYTSIFNPHDGRKNWRDILTAFTWACREHDDATLVMKLTCKHSQRWPAMIDEYLDLLPESRARILFINGYLDEDSYESLALNSSYAVNASHGEGQCLPLMEYMSCGTPAISPCHTGMRDYIAEKNAFVVDSTLEPVAWPDDTRRAYRTTQFRINWESLRACFETSFTVAKDEPLTYKRMAKASVKTLKGHCSRKSAKRKLSVFFRLLKRQLEMNEKL